ncbi:hypothetical protein [Streptomyces anulatus]|uniref:hypothetical protein n=1 Tax=Streptomyces anulatus TaxID=1892 RepID=UPI002F9142FA
MNQDTQRTPAGPGQGQQTLFAPATRTTLTCCGEDGGPLTDDDFAALELLLAAYRVAGSGTSVAATTGEAR